MSRSAIRIAALLVVLGVGSTPARAQLLGWRQHAINAASVFEGAGAFDVDGDGRVDVVSGDTWYQAPAWTPYPVRKVSQSGSYRNCFSTMPMDVNGDGRLDYVTCSYFERNVGWVENPGTPGREWTYHEIDRPGPSEAAVLVDLDGDGQLDVLPNTVNVVVWYSLDRTSSPPAWRKHDFGTAAAGHGVGSGDVNADGRTDLLTPKGWFEAPADARTNDRWSWHPDWNLGTAGIQILARDMNRDGRADVVFGMGHDRGLFWLEQGVGADGRATWTREPIDSTFTSVHVLNWVDLDGDGARDELLSGKRVYAHEIEPGDVEAPEIAYYRHVLPPGGANPWQKVLIYQGSPAGPDTPKEGSKRNAQRDFPPGTAGTGLEVPVVDMDGDGDLDLVCPGKSGLYWFENPLRAAAGAPGD